MFAKKPSSHQIDAIRSVGDELDNLLLNAYLSETTLLITLDSGKVYVVFVYSTPKPRQTKYVEFSPLFSGYRNSTHEIEITTNYIEVLDSNPQAKFRIVIELADITSLQPWDAKLYNDRFKLQQIRDGARSYAICSRQCLPSQFESTPRPRSSTDRIGVS